MLINSKTWLTDLETALAQHIEEYLVVDSNTFDVRIGDTELPRPLEKPCVVISTSDDVVSHIGGMDIIDDNEQGYRHDQRFYILIITDRDSGGQRMRADACSVLTHTVFGTYKPTFLVNIGGIELSLVFDGYYTEGATGDNTQYIAQFVLVVSLIVPFISNIL